MKQRMMTELTFRTRNKKQIEAIKAWLDDTVEEIVYGGGKGGGKSFLGASLIFADALTYDGTNYFIARKELNDLRKFTIPTIHEVFEKWGLSVDDYMSFNGQDNCFKLKNGSIVYLIACKEEPSDPLFERFGSMQMTRGWIEEAGEVAEAAKANLMLSIGRWKNDVYKLKKKLLMTCNPKKGWLKRNFVDPFKNGVLGSAKRYIQALIGDNPYLPQDYVNTLANESDPVRRARLYLGDWDYDTTVGSIFEGEPISDLWTNVLTPEDMAGKYMTVDIARFGNDKTVLYFWQGFKLYGKEVYTLQSIPETAQRIKDAARREGIPYSHIVADEDGVGGGVVDLCRGIHGFVNNSTALPDENPKYDELKKPNFSNLKTQCAWIMARKTNHREAAISLVHAEQAFIDELEQELSIYRIRKPDNDMQKVSLVPKDEMKAELGRSPDYGDAFIMRGFFTLKRQFRALTHEQEVSLIKQEIADQMDYDPYDVL